MGAGGSSAGAKGELLETMADHEESINCMVISEDGSMLVTGSEDHTARSGFFLLSAAFLEKIQRKNTSVLHSNF